MSRTVSTCPLGKCTREVKTLVPEEMGDDLAAVAHIAGKTVSEYVRDHLALHLYGQKRMLRLAQGLKD